MTGESVGAPDTAFAISISGDKVTVTHNDKSMSGTLGSKKSQGNGYVYTVNNVSWGSWGKKWFADGDYSQKKLQILVPKDAFEGSKSGRWAWVVTAHEENENYPWAWSGELVYKGSSRTGTYGYTASHGKAGSDDATGANPLKSDYDPNNTLTGGDHNLRMDLEPSEQDSSGVTMGIFTYRIE